MATPTDEGNWEFTEELPTLTTDTLPQWFSTLKKVLTIHELDTLLTTDLPPTSPFNKKAVASCQYMITKSFSPEVAKLLPASTYDDSPRQIVATLKTKLQGNANTNPDILILRALALSLSDFSSIDAFFDAHVQIQNQLIDTNAPGFTPTNEAATVKLILQGLSRDKRFGSVIPTIYLTGIPASVEDLRARVQIYEHNINLIDPSPAIQGVVSDNASRRAPEDNSTNSESLLVREIRRLNRNLEINRKIRAKQATQDERKQQYNNDDRKGRGKNNRKPRAQNAYTNTTQHTDPSQEEDQLAAVIKLLTNHNPDPNNETESENDRTYILDSAAHPTHVNHPLQHAQRAHSLTTITATSNNLKPLQQGTLKVLTSLGKSLHLPALMHPKIRSNLLSVHDICRQYGGVLFFTNRALILNTQSNPPSIAGTGQWTGNCYKLDKRNSQPHMAGIRAVPTASKKSPQTTPPPPPRKPSKRKTSIQQGAHPLQPSVPRSPQKTTLSTRTQFRLPDPEPATHLDKRTATFYAWHIIFNHVQLRTLQLMAREGLLPLPNELKGPVPEISCSSCTAAKARRASHPPTTHRHAIGVAVSSDVCGPIAKPSTHGNKYIITFLDCASRYAYAHFSATRKSVLTFIITMVAIVRRLHGTTPQLITTDNAKEYISGAARDFLARNGITPQPTVPYTPQENSLAERFNGTLLAGVRSALHHAKLTEEYWEDAARDAVFKYNLTRHTATGKIPYIASYGSTPPVTHLFAFGQLGSIPHVTSETRRKKLDDRGFLARYMYATDPTHIVVMELATGKYRQIRAVNFRPYSQRADPNSATANVYKCYTPHPTPTEITPHTPPPKSRQQAQKYPDSKQWANAHNAEIEKLNNMKAIKWLPPHRLPSKLIPLKMTYRYKRDTCGNIIERKARCAVRGDLMKPHQHFNQEHTAAHLALKMSIRLIFSLAAGLSLHLDHFDITSAFPHENYQFSKPVFVRQHPHFDGTLKYPSVGGQLIKNIYGTPSGGYYYLIPAMAYLRKLGLTQSEDDPCLFVRFRDKENFIIICLNIDDFLVAATHPTLIDHLFRALKRKYNIKRLGRPTQYLGWKIQYNPAGDIHLSQPHYVQKALDIAQMPQCNSKPTPLPKCADPSPPTDDDIAMPHIRTILQQILGELRWIADCTRPDIAFPVLKLALAMQNPTRRHWLLMKHVLRYLKGTQTYGIKYSNQTKSGDEPQATPPTPELQSYSDSDFAADTTSRKSTTGTVHTINESLIEWTSSRQSLQALSTCEAEYIAASTAAQQTQLIRRILAHLHIPTPSIPFYVDNIAAIGAAKNLGSTRKRKFIDLRHHFLREHHRRGNINIRHIRSTENPADLLTKPLSLPKFSYLCDKLRIVQTNRSDAPFINQKPASSSFHSARSEGLSSGSGSSWIGDKAECK